MGEAGKGEKEKLRKNYSMLVMLRKKISKRETASFRFLEQIDQTPLIPVGHIDSVACD